MSSQISPDFERLSAYIDNQLSPAEKAELEARLAREPQLQAGLDDLRRTVLALRSLPQVKPPRSFTLTPEQAGVRVRRGRLFPALRLAAALCTLLLIVTVARDWATSGALLSNSVANPAVSASTGGSAGTPPTVPQAAVMKSPTPEAPHAFFGASAPAVTGTPGSDQAATPMVRMNTIQPSATPGPTLKSGGPSETPAANTSVGVDTGPGNPLAAASGTAPAGVTAEPSSTAEPGITLEASGTPEATEATAISVAELSPAATDTVIPDLVPVPPAPQPTPFNPWRLVEIGLAVLALVLAGATWLTRRG